VRAQLDAVVTGRRVTVATDPTWQTRPSHLSHIGQWTWNDFGGERLDASRAVPGWNLPGGADASWRPALPGTAPASQASAQNCPPNRIGERLPAVSVTPLAGGRYELDFGRNLTGWLNLRLAGLAAGQTVRLFFADRLFPDGRQASPIGDISIRAQSCVTFARADGGTNWYQNYHQVIEFISAGAPREVFQHKFNYAGFRYVVVEGLPAAPRKSDATALLVESALEPVGSFECSDELLNRIHRLNRWTLRCLNLGGYVVDCPHRERRGYGDGQVSLPGMMMNFSAANFFEKWARDWRHAQDPETGAMPNIAPSAKGGGGPPWAGLIAALPWQHYLWYGNRRVLEDNFQAAKKYIQYLDSRSADDILRAWGTGFAFLGDWVPPGRGMDTRNWPTREMAELFCNCYRVYLWQVVTDMAQALGRADDAALGRARLDSLRPAVHQAFYDPARQRYVIDEQIYYAMPLLTGVTPEPERAAVWANLQRNLLEKNHGHLDTGMLGTMFLLKYLDESGHDDLALKIYQQKTYPGWGYMAEQGATTLWEQWNGYWSQIHSCFASADNWLYLGLAGIRPDPAGPGFRKIIIEPAVVGDITWVKAGHRGPYGLIRSHWRREGARFTLEVTVPPNSDATVILPGGATHQVGSGTWRWTVPAAAPLR
jgi:alpha-L-rhamnosidase